MQDQKQNKIRWRKIFHSSANSLPLSRLWRKNGSSPKCSLLSLYLLARMPHKEILSLPFVTISCYPTQEQSCSLIFLIQWLKPFIPSHLLWYASIQQLLCTNLMLGMCVKEKSTSGFLDTLYVLFKFWWARSSAVRRRGDECDLCVNSDPLEIAQVGWLAWPVYRHFSKQDLRLIMNYCSHWGLAWARNCRYEFF